MADGCFGSPQFNVADWINDCLSEVDDTDWESVESNISGLLMKLQHDSQGLNSKLEEEMEHLLASIPRALREIDRIGRDSESLKGSLLRISTDSQTKENDADNDADNESTIETLEHLHTIKNNLEQSLHVLERSENWNRLVREVEDKFASRDLAGVAERIGGLRNSLELLDGMPGGSERTDVLLRMEQRLETLIGPGLRDAITMCLKSEEDGEDASGVLEAQQHENREVQEQETVLQGYVTIFEKLGRLDHLCNDFAEARASFFLDDWDEMSNLAKEHEWAFVDWLSRYFEKFCANLDREITRCGHVFGEVHAPKVLRKIAIEALGYITPGFKKELSLLSIDSTVNALERTCEFADSLQNSVDGWTKLPDGSFQYVNSVMDACLEPFQVFFDSYMNIELQALNFDLEKACGKMSSANILDILRNPSIVEISIAAVQRSLLIAQGGKSRDLIAGIDAFWSGIISKAIQVIQQVFGDTTEFVVDELSSGWEDRMYSALKYLEGVSSFIERLLDCKETKLGMDLVEPVRALEDSICANKKPSSTSEYISMQIFAEKMLPADLSHKINVHEMINQGLSTSTTKLEKLVIITQTAVYDMMLLPIVQEWRSISRMKVWAVETDEEAKMLGKDEETISSFGAPLKYMTRVTTKYFFSIIDQLEPFSSNRITRSLIPDKKQLGANPRHAVETALGLEADSRLGVLEQSEFDQEEGEVEDESNIFMAPWLGVVALGAADTLIVEIMKIPKIGQVGAKQLSTDLGCLSKLISNITATDSLLEDFHATLAMPREQIATALEEESAD
eukprot:CAMPEP_0203756366 /NCGR_PEP_ID=MMETSP0098-20131031/9672_1 /ASSEMBLY_ACC=CAM_ASM_000208 /TAXON_ID=96639 /ORGANISM=" , Strain NY0313808BC1" /LENGTH=794 /DNA_ID=CAMNT_0050648231 /DNA_START=353 /DNA_END=2734 /DNA_ORIENTATION=+